MVAGSHVPGTGVYCLRTDVPVRNVVGTPDANPTATTDLAEFSLRALIVDPTAAGICTGFNVVVDMFVEEQGGAGPRSADHNFYLAFAG